MIESIKQNIAFGTTTSSQLYSNVTKSNLNNTPKPQPAPVIAAEEQPKENKKTFGQFMHNIKLKTINFYKGFNNIKDTTMGALKGAVEGAATAVVFGTFGSNLAKSKKEIAQNLKEAASNAAQAASSEAKNAGKNLENYPLGKLVFKTVSGTISDVFNSIGDGIKYIPKILNQDLKTTFKDIGKLPGKFIKYMDKSTGSKKLTILTAALGGALIVYKAVQGKIKANKKNANIDHALNEGHVSTK